MFRPAALALLAVSLFALQTKPSIAQSPDPPHSAPSTAVSTADYVRRAAISEVFEIQSSQLALRKSTSERVKAFAEMMVHDHTKSSEKLKAALSGEEMRPPETLDATRAELLEKLKAADGAEFDQLYWDMQIAGHEQALELHRGYAQAGSDAALKKVAAEIVPVVEAHLAKLRQRA